MRGIGGPGDDELARAELLHELVPEAVAGVRATSASTAVTSGPDVVVTEEDVVVLFGQRRDHEPPVAVLARLHPAFGTADPHPVGLELVEDQLPRWWVELEDDVEADRTRAWWRRWHEAVVEEAGPLLASFAFTSGEDERWWRHHVSVSGQMLRPLWPGVHRRAGVARLSAADLVDAVDRNVDTGRIGAPDELLVEVLGNWDGAFAVSPRAARLAPPAAREQ